MEHLLKSSKAELPSMKKMSTQAKLKPIIDKIEFFFEVSLRDPKRRRKTAYARYIYFHTVRKMFEDQISLMDIGESVGRDHSTVIHGIRMVEQSEKYNKFLFDMLNRFSNFCQVGLNEDSDVKEYYASRDIEALTREILRLRTKETSFPILAKLNTFLLNCDEDIKESVLFKIETIYQLNKKINDGRKSSTTAN